MEENPFFATVHFCAYTPVLIRAVAEPMPTCLIAPNEWYANILYKWCVLAGIRVPQDLSIITFDNYGSWSFLPVSTLDFGFDSLGYAAAHLLLKDVPIRRDRHNTVDSRSHLVHRGSLGPPRQAPLDNGFLRAARDIALPVSEGHES